MYYPFTTISNNELCLTIKGRKVKFIVVTKRYFANQDLIDQLNGAMEDPTSDNFFDLILTLRTRSSLVCKLVHEGAKNLALFTQNLV